MSKTKTYLFGGDDRGWALDNDLAMIGRSLEDVVRLVSIDDAEVVHAVWWEKLNSLRRDQLAGKRVICHLSGEPFRYFTLQPFQEAISRVNRWITQSTQATRQLASLGMACSYIPYTVDTQVFQPIDDKPGLREKWGLPTDRFLIGSFQRDSEGSDLTKPKLVKGPDLFAEACAAAFAKNNRVHVVLAGPRRHWLRNRLDELGVPYTQLGKLTHQDDYPDNSLPHAQLSELYNALDLYLVTSRSEGGPRSVLECAATKCPILSTDVGLARDVLEPDCICDSPSDLFDQVTRLDATNSTEIHYQRVLENHQPRCVTERFRQLYDDITSVPKTYITPHDPQQSKSPQLARKLMAKVWPGRRREDLTVGLWHNYVKPPYGGGNQFMLALKKGLLARGISVVENRIDEGVDAYVLNSIHFDVERFTQLRATRDIAVVHRIDGPIHLIRGFDREKDELCYRLNKQFASATVIQSTWTLQRIFGFGYAPINPTIIRNGVDPDIYYATEKPPPIDRKIRLVSSSWSDNPLKGGPLYRWLDQNLDWSRFEYTFVGRASESFDRIRQIAPVPSEELAAELRQHDVYITASQCDPCSNALIEGMACGLPALYMNDGGHPELVGFGGLPFHDNQDVLPQLDRLVANYDQYQQLVTVPPFDQVVEQYLQVLRSVADSSKQTRAKRAG